MSFARAHRYPSLALIDILRSRSRGLPAVTPHEEPRLARRKTFCRDAYLRARLGVGQRAKEVRDQVVPRRRRVGERDVADLQPVEQEIERRPLDAATERPAAEDPGIDAQAPAG